jgi:hypothetical protein
VSPSASDHQQKDITIVTAPRYVVIGADTHLDTIHLAAITDAGKPLADSEFATSPAHKVRIVATEHVRERQMISDKDNWLNKTPSEL